MASAASSTFEQICDALAIMGLSRVIAAPVLIHACKSIGVTAEELSARHVAQLGPVLEKSLRMYVGEEQVAAGLKRVYTLAGGEVRPTTRDTLRAVAAHRPPKS